MKVTTPPMPPTRRRPAVSWESSTDLGQALRGLREARGMTQAEVAGGELTKALVSQIELGRTRPSLQTLEILAGRLGTSADALIASIPGQPAEVRVPTDARIQLRRIEALLRVGRLDEAARHLDGCGTWPAPDLRATTLRLTAEVRLRTGDLRGAAEAAAGAAAAAARGQHHHEEALAANLAGRTHFAARRFTAACQCFNDALDACARSATSDARLISRLLVNRGNAHWRMGDNQRAQEDFEEALRRAEEAEDLRQLALAHMGLGEMHRDQGDLEDARTHVEQAIALFERLEERLLLVQNLHNLAEITAEMGEAAQARALLVRTLDSALAMGDGRTAAYALERLAAGDLELGDVRSALRRSDDAVARARTLLDGQVLSQSLATRGDALQARGAVRAADRAYAEAVEVARRDGPQSLRLALLRRGALERRRGDLSAAAASFESAARVGLRRQAPA